jgi:hypothetical protein
MFELLEFLEGEALTARSAVAADCWYTSLNTSELRSMDFKLK